MLQFIIVFFGVLVSIFTSNVFTSIGSVFRTAADAKIEAYIYSAMQRHVSLFSFCGQNPQDCSASNMPSLIDFLPKPLVSGDIQKNIYNCLQTTDFDGNAELIILTAYQGFFFDSWNVSSDHVVSLAYSLLVDKKLDTQISIYTSKSEFVNNKWDDISSCINAHNPNNEPSLFLISQKILKG